MPLGHTHRQDPPSLSRARSALFPSSTMDTRRIRAQTTLGQHLGSCTAHCGGSGTPGSCGDKGTPRHFIPESRGSSPPQGCRQADQDVAVDADDGVWQDCVLVLVVGRKDKTSGRGATTPPDPLNCPSITCPAIELSLAHHHDPGEAAQGGCLGSPNRLLKAQTHFHLSPGAAQPPAKGFGAQPTLHRSGDTSVLITWDPTGASGRGTPGDPHPSS